VSFAHGQCIEHYGPGEAYLPLLDALGRRCRSADGERVVAGLRQHAPMWLVQLPAFIAPEERGALQRQVQGAARERMLRELTEALEALTAEHPLVLWLEDLQWSDVSTLDWLAFEARRKEPARLLVIGTYRPVEMFSDGHPLKNHVQELMAHHLCAELALGPLSEADIEKYLTARLSFPSPLMGEGQGKGEMPRFLYSLAHTLHQRTAGNPLFLVSTVDDLVTQGVLTQTNGEWTLRGELGALSIPETICQLVARQRERLQLEDQRVLAAASVAGMEFSAAAVAAALTMDTTVVERHCERLAERQHFLRRVGIEEWPDGTLAARYTFLHALYQQLWHERVTPTQLQHHHLQIGQRKERAYGDRAGEIAAELAVHFEQGQDYGKAVRYLQQAGQRAVQRSANVEAIAHFTKGLELLKTLPDTPERPQQELTLQIALGAPLAATKGQAAPEVASVYLASLAKAYEEVGRVEEGLSVLAEAPATVDRTGERYYEAELYRLKGQLTLQRQSKVQSLKSLAPKPKPKRVFARLLRSRKNSKPKCWSYGRR
jgi:predicted ATPase